MIQTSAWGKGGNLLPKMVGAVSGSLRVETVPSTTLLQVRSYNLEVKTRRPIRRRTKNF
jgi:hypothetical protein